MGKYGDLGQDLIDSRGVRDESGCAWLAAEVPKPLETAVLVSASRSVCGAADACCRGALIPIVILCTRVAA